MGSGVQMSSRTAWTKRHNFSGQIEKVPPGCFLKIALESGYWAPWGGGMGQWGGNISQEDRMGTASSRMCSLPSSVSVFVYVYQ